jgi:uncharacterized protein (TIGR03382 family)
MAAGGAIAGELQPELWRDGRNPEPGTLGMLALDAMDVLAWQGWRRRK